MKHVGIYLQNEHALVPTRATAESACYDVYACLPDNTRVDVKSDFNESRVRVIKDGLFTLFPGERALIPTGCVFDIPVGFSIRLHPRSGISFKHGVCLANAEGVIDSDYYHQTLVALINHSEASFVIKHGDRIAQLELTPTVSINLETLSSAPRPRTTRAGGFGSSGIEQ